MPKVTLCSYTYNDASLLHGLLASALHWSLQPSEIIIVDDASAQPFALEQDSFPIPVTIFRNETNKGPAYTKNFGISRATSGSILSLDCDIRISHRWLENALHILANNSQIGILGAPIESGSAHSISARYDRITSSYHCAQESVDFLNGSIWLFSQKMWLHVGGFGTYDKRTHEDHHFCARVRQCGYTLHAALPLPPARQIRRLHYTDILRRLWVWKGTEAINKSGSILLRALLIANIHNQHERMRYFMDSGQEEFCYIELLYFLHTSLTSIDAAGSAHTYPDSGMAYDCILLFLHTIRNQYPKIFELLLLDLKTLRYKNTAKLFASLAALAQSLPDQAVTQDMLTETMCETWNARTLHAITTKIDALYAELGAETDFTFYKEMP